MAIRKTKSVLLKPFLFENDYNVLNKTLISGLINTFVQPLYNFDDEINIVFKFQNEKIKNDFEKKHLQRLRFKNTKVFNLENEDFAQTEFLIITSKQYSACILFDFSLAENKDEAVFCTYCNSKKIDEILNIILPDENFPRERRENPALNDVLLNLIKLSENSTKELSINEAEKNNLEYINQTLKRDEFLAKKSRYISHEIKNHLSIIDVYTKIIEKTCCENESAQNATKIIFKSIQNVTKLLQNLKTFSDADLNMYNLNSVINEALKSVEEMAFSNGISLSKDLPHNVNVIIDKDKFQNVILNLIKNAVEALKETDKKEKEIIISSQIKGDEVSLFIQNNGEKIDKENQERIFEEGFTTKNDGSGLGLYICRQNLAEQFCELSLLKSTDAMTVFEIKMKKTD